MKLLKINFFLIMLILSAQLHAQQNIGIGTTIPNAKAIVDISSTTKGVLLPRLTTEQRDAIANPAKGLQIINLDDMCTDTYDGASWIKACGLKVSAIIMSPENHATANSWVRKLDFVNSRIGTVHFTLNNKGYIGMGRSNITESTLWEYNPIANTWTQRATFPGTARLGASSFVINQKAYVVAGTPLTVTLNDCWEYDPVGNAWTPKASMPAAGRIYAYGFAVGNKGYISCGEGAGIDLWEFDPVANGWTARTAPPFSTVTSRSRGIAFGIGNKGYIGAGYQNPAILSDFWEYNPANDSWTQKADFGGGMRSTLTGFAMNGRAFAGMGYFLDGSSSAVYMNDWWKYDPALDTWTLRTALPTSGRLLPAGFAIGRKAYVGIGSGITGFIDLWEYQDELDSSIVYNSTPPYSILDTYNDGSWTINGTTIYNSNSGNVGIGTTTPSQKLEVAGTAKITGIETTTLLVNGTTTTASFRIPTGATDNYILKTDASGNASWVNPTALSITEADPQVGAISANRIPKWNGSALVDGILQDNNAIGIGVTPHGSLQFPNGNLNRKIILHEDANDDHQYYGFGVNNATLRYQVPSAGSHIFYAATGAGSSNELMRIQSNGNVGIGTSNPQAVLHVAGGITSPNEQRSYFHVNTGSNIAQDVNATGNVVIRADGYIWANGGGYLATSDARIKNIIGRSNRQNDLAIINKIEITNYKYKDEVANGSGLQKKVIAQQVKEIYSIAVNTNKGVIPNVFEVAKQLKVVGNSTMITTSKPHSFTTGDEVRIIFNKSGERTFEVTVKDAYTFSIPITTTENVFVYGKNVNDLLNVDYDALTTLNISATQQLDKEIEEMRAEYQKKIAELQKQLSVFANK